MVVYIDVVLIENFLINFFLLLITIQIMSGQISYKRIAISSTIGIVYVAMIFIPTLMFLSSMIFKLLVAFIMVFFTQEEKHLFTILKVFIIFLLVSFTFSGMCFMFALTQNEYSLLQNFNIKNYSIKYLIFAVIIIYITINRLRFYLKDRFILNNLLYDLEINIENNIIKVKGFLDTGNELMEPITLLPVIIIEKSVIPNINIPKEECFKIPYGLVNGQTGYMYGIKTKDVKLYKNDKEKPIIKKAIVCLCDKKLDSNGDYKALLSRGII